MAIQVFFKLFDSRTVRIACPSSCTATDLKRELARVTGLPAHEQRLTYRGKPLQRSAAVFAPDIDLATVHVSLRLRGGFFNTDAKSIAFDADYAASCDVTYDPHWIEHDRFKKWDGLAFSDAGVMLDLLTTGVYERCSRRLTGSPGGKEEAIRRWKDDQAGSSSRSTADSEACKSAPVCPTVAARAECCEPQACSADQPEHTSDREMNDASLPSTPLSISTAPDDFEVSASPPHSAHLPSDTMDYCTAVSSMDLPVAEPLFTGMGLDIPEAGGMFYDSDFSDGSASDSACTQQHMLDLPLIPEEMTGRGESPMFGLAAGQRQRWLADSE